MKEIKFSLLWENVEGLYRKEPFGDWNLLIEGRTSCRYLHSFGAPILKSKNENFPKSGEKTARHSVME